MTEIPSGLPRREAEPSRTPEVPNIGRVVDKCETFYTSILKPLAAGPFSERQLTIPEIAERYSPLDSASIKALVGFDELSEMLKGSDNSGEERKEVSQDGYEGYAMTSQNKEGKNQLTIDLKKPTEEGNFYSARRVHYTVGGKHGEETSVEIIDRPPTNDHYNPWRHIVANFSPDRHDFRFEARTSFITKHGHSQLSDDPDGKVFSADVRDETYRQDQPDFEELARKFEKH